MTRFITGTMYGETKLPVAIPASSVRYITVNSGKDHTAFVFLNAQQEDGSGDYIRLNETYEDISAQVSAWFY